MGRKQTFAAMTATAPVTAEPYIPYPASVPIVAEHHNVAAVFSPVMFSPLRRITPAPRNPIPETTYPAMRKLSSARSVSAESMTNIAAPAATNAFVRSPAMRCRYWRSAPIKAPSTSASPNRIAK